MEKEMTCGEELAASALVPEEVGALFAHVALNLRAHAAWVGTASEPAAREHAALIEVAQGYEAIHAAGAGIAQRMRGFAKLAPSPHDPGKLDRASFAAWMKTKIDLQRRLAALLLEHADRSEQGLPEFAAQRRR